MIAPSEEPSAEITGAYRYQKKPRSVSQLKQWEKCGYAYYLDRIQKNWKRPAAWLDQGTAVHAVAEQWLRRKLDGDPMTREQAHKLFKETYSDGINTLADETPNLGWWFASGRYRGEEDIERRWDVGLEQVDKLIDWIEAHPEEQVWTAPDGQLGLELEIDTVFGDVQVRGFIDAVVLIDGKPQVRDWKTGVQPGDDFQLAVYAVALRKMYGVEITHGHYFMAGKRGQKASMTYPYDLTDWTEERIAEKFRELEEGLAAGAFEPTTDPKNCERCDVAFGCPFSRA